MLPDPHLGGPTRNYGLACLRLSLFQNSLTFFFSGWSTIQEREELQSENSFDALKGMRCVPSIAFLSATRLNNSEAGIAREIYIADFTEIVRIFNQLFEHRVGNIAQLKSRRLFRQVDTVEYMGCSGT